MTIKEICDRFGLDAEDYLFDWGAMAMDVWKKIRRDPGYGKTFKPFIERQWIGGELYYDCMMILETQNGVQRVFNRHESRTDMILRVAESIIERGL